MDIPALNCQFICLSEINDDDDDDDGFTWQSIAAGHHTRIQRLTMITACAKTD